MAKLVVFGATGYAGGRISAEALSRGHEVVGVARNAGEAPEGVDLRQGSLHDEEFVAGLARIAAEHGARLSFVGGASSLYVAEGGPRLLDTPEFPAEYKTEASNHADVLYLLREQPDELDWFYV